MEKYTKTIEKRISEMTGGYVFSHLDFIDLCSYNTVNKIIQRLIEEGKIKKIIKGIYYKPSFSKFLNEEVSPSVDNIAHAIARNFNWNITPSGDAALNILGLSTQVPANWVYITDGAYRTYSFGKIKIIFKRTNNKNIKNLSFKTVLVIQALKALGKGNVNDEIIDRIKICLKQKEKQIMLKEAITSTTWIYECIKKICEVKNDRNS